MRYVPDGWTRGERVDVVKIHLGGFPVPYMRLCKV